MAETELTEQLSLQELLLKQRADLGHFFTLIVFLLGLL